MERYHTTTLLYTTRAPWAPRCGGVTDVDVDGSPSALTSPKHAPHLGWDRACVAEEERERREGEREGGRESISALSLYAAFSNVSTTPLRWRFPSWAGGW